MPGVDMRYLCTAKATRVNGALTHTGGRQLADAISAEVDPVVISGEYYAGGRRKYAPSRMAGANIKLITDTLDYANQQALLGHEYTEDGPQISTLDDVGSPVGLGFYVEDQGGFFEARFYPLVTFSEGKTDSQTFQGSYNFISTELSGVIEATESGEWRVQQRFSTRAEAVAWINDKLGITAGGAA